MSGEIQTLFANHAALLGEITAGVLLLNIALSAAAQALAALHKTVPPGLQKVSLWLQKVVAWLSANTPPPPAV